MNDLGSLVLSYRAKENISQEEFANRAKVNVMTINRVEKGIVCSKMTKAKIELVLNERKED